MGEVEKVASLLEFLAPSSPGTRKQNGSLRFRPGRCQFFFPPLQLMLEAGWGRGFFCLFVCFVLFVCFPLSLEEKDSIEVSSLSEWSLVGWVESGGRKRLGPIHPSSKRRGGI